MANYLIPGSESTLKHTYVLTIPTTWAVKDLSMETTLGVLCNHLLCMYPVSQIHLGISILYPESGRCRKLDHEAALSSL